jgi:hypothetical protein
VLIPALESFGLIYRRELGVAIVERLGLTSRGEAADGDVAQAVFAGLTAGGEALRWEPLFHDWYGGGVSERRALEGPRGAVYADPAFTDLRRLLEIYEPANPRRLDSPLLAAPEPEEMLIDEVEALWDAIAARDDWTPLRDKLDRLEAVRALRQDAEPSP